MTGARFQSMLAAFGAAPRRWPEAERAEAQAQAAAQPDLVRAEAALDRALDLYVAPADEDAFTARAMARFMAPGAEIVAMPRRRQPSPIWALAACALIGIALGFGFGASAPTDGAYETLAGAFGAQADIVGEETGG